MADTPVTLRRVFEIPEDDEPDESPGRWKAAQDRIREEVKGIKLPAAMPDLAPKICQLFDVKIPDVLLTSWKKVDALKALLEKSKKAPEQTMYLELADHTINCEQKPHIDMKLKNVSVKKIEFLVKLTFKLKGFVLKIKEGKVKEMETGSCEVQGTVSYAGQVIAEKKMAPIKLPGSIPLQGSENGEESDDATDVAR
jgi:hypothetical protein